MTARRGSAEVWVYEWLVPGDWAEETSVVPWSLKPSALDKRHGACGRPMSIHGWLDSLKPVAGDYDKMARTVCPGDWIIVLGRERFRLSPGGFGMDGFTPGMRAALIRRLGTAIEG